jgi:hypothetical protein
LYTSIPEIMRAIEQVEKEARPWIHEATLLRIRNFVRKCIWDLRWCAFLPENTDPILQKLRDCLIVGVVMLNGHVLSVPEPDPRCFIKGEDVKPKMFVTPEMISAVRSMGVRAVQISHVTQKLANLDPAIVRWPVLKDTPNQPKRVRFSLESSVAAAAKEPAQLHRLPITVAQAIETLETHTEPWLSWLTIAEEKKKPQGHTTKIVGAAK